MLPVSESLRLASVSKTIQPNVQVLLRRLRPGWTKRADTCAGYIETPDLIGGSAKSGVLGTFQAAYGGWNVPIGSDCEVAPTAIIRILNPAAYDENSAQFYVFVADNPSLASIWSTPLQTITVSGSQKALQRCRGSLQISGGVSRYYYIGVDGGVWRLQGNDSGGAWQTPVKVVNTTKYASVISAAVAAVADGRFFVLYTTDSRRLFIDYYSSNTLTVDSYAIGYCFDDVPHWSAIHHFDAVDFGSKTILTVNTSKFGSSRAFLFEGNVFSEPLTILPYDDADWNGLLRVSNLSVIGGRVFGVAWQRFAQSDDSYSQELCSIVWSNDGIHWSQAPHLVVGVEPFFGKILALGEYVYLIGNAIVYSGDATIDFGGAGAAVQLDISDSLVRLSIDRLNDGTGSSQNYELKRSDTLMQPDTWIPYADQVAVKLGYGAGEKELIGLGYVQMPSQEMTVGQKTISLQASGTLAQLGQYEQFADDFGARSVQTHADMTENTLINRLDSVWGTEEGQLHTVFGNSADESLCLFSDRLWGGFVMQARLQYEAGVTAFGLAAWAGLPAHTKKQMLAMTASDGTSLYTSEDLGDHNFVLVRFTPAANNTVNIHLVRRSGEKVNGAWVDTDTTLAGPWTVSWAPVAWRTALVRYQQGLLVLYLHNGSTWSTIFSTTVAAVLPQEWQAGLWAKSPRAETTESLTRGVTVLPVTGAEEWPLTGTVEIEDESYGYTLNAERTTMTLDRGLATYISTAYTLSPFDDRLLCDWAQIASTDMRWDAADIAKHVCMRAGMALQPDNLALAENWIHSSGAVWNGSAWTLTTGTSIRNGLPFGDYASEVYVTGLGDGDFIEWRPWSLQHFAAIALRLTVTDGIGVLSLRDQAGAEIVVSTPTWLPPSACRLRLITHEGWLHVYCNNRHLGSVYSVTAKRQFGEMSIAGNGVNIIEAVIEAGCEYVIYGIWDGQTPAREVLSTIFNGLPLMMIENENSTIRLAHIFYPQNLGTQSVSLLPQIGFQRSKTIRGAMSVFGGYDWVIEFDPVVLAATGLRWGKIDNDSLWSLAATRYYAALEGARARGELRQHTFTGRYDPAMQIGDSFTSPGFANYAGGEYTIASLNISYNTAGPILTCKGTAVGKPELP